MEEKRKKKRIRRILGLTIGELCAFLTLVGALIGSIAAGVHYFDGKFAHIDRQFEGIDRQFEEIDRRFEGIDRRLDRIEDRLDHLEVKLNQTSDLLDSYLTWRFIYVNDPLRKNLVPLYDPKTRTIEFVDGRKGRK